LNSIPQGNEDNKLTGGKEMLDTYLSAVPAYGRDYKSKKELLIDWEAGKDFAMMSFRGATYFSIMDIKSLKENGVRQINFRYKKQMQVCTITL